MTTDKSCRSSTTGQTMSSPKAHGEQMEQQSILPCTIHALTRTFSTGSSPPPASSPKAYKTSDPAKAMSSSQTPTGQQAGAASSTARSKKARGQRWQCKGTSVRRRRRNRARWWRTCSLGNKGPSVFATEPRGWKTLRFYRERWSTTTMLSEGN
jgi:hypothetical protein